ncbi:hypothetical protein AWB68_07777 [Caballeronia choica]|uniref:Uncharacterized protein n=1 Tax=Caballeronia choica TaxID=326476 RepID=A0A158KX32_9BURK|nr:hypothetical protein AWB68_07777 [Caballeronia choica]
MSEQHKPGETVKTSGIYKVVRESNGAPFEVTCVEGEHFPPTRSGKGALRAGPRGHAFAQA